jgi:hypothetical protein
MSSSAKKEYLEAVRKRYSCCSRTFVLATFPARFRMFRVAILSRSVCNRDQQEILHWVQYRLNSFIIFEIDFFAAGNNESIY